MLGHDAHNLRTCAAVPVCFSISSIVSLRGVDRIVLVPILLNPIGISSCVHLEPLSFKGQSTAAVSGAQCTESGDRRKRTRTNIPHNRFGSNFCSRLGGPIIGNLPFKIERKSGGHDNSSSTMYASRCLRRARKSTREIANIEKMPIKIQIPAPWYGSSRTTCRFTSIY